MSHKIDLKDGSVYLAVTWGVLRTELWLKLMLLKTLKKHCSKWSCSPSEHVLLRVKWLLLCRPHEEQISVVRIQHTYPSCSIPIEKAISPEFRAMRNVCAVCRGCFFKSRSILSSGKSLQFSIQLRYLSVFWTLTYF